jgi:hypothetical protein
VRGRPELKITGVKVIPTNGRHNYQWVFIGPRPCFRVFTGIQSIEV